MFKKSLGLIAAAGLMAASVSPSFAFSFKIKHNGADSYNKITFSSLFSKTLTQTNQTQLNNKVKVDVNTGGNQANKNTGGNTSVTSGDTTTSIGILNQGDSNLASSDDCGCQSPDTDVVIKDNGADSTNKVDVNTSTVNLKTQVSLQSIFNGIFAHIDTGDNQANKNTGDEGSSNTVTSGSSTTEVSIINEGNTNLLE